VKLVEIGGVEKWEVEKILNKRKIREVMKYLVQVLGASTWCNGKDLQ